MSDDHAQAEFGCRYSMAYRGACGDLAGADHLCAKHSGVGCRVCGKQAVAECCHTGQFVCGVPLCEDCEGWTDYSQPSGSWGFMNHSHRVKPAAEQQRGHREMVAGDILPRLNGEAS